MKTLLFNTDVGTLVRVLSTGRIGMVTGWSGGAVAIIQYANGDTGEVSGFTVVEVIYTPIQLGSIMLGEFVRADVLAKGANDG